MQPKSESVNEKNKSGSTLTLLEILLALQLYNLNQQSYSHRGKAFEASLKTFMFNTPSDQPLRLAMTFKFCDFSSYRFNS